MNENNDDKKNNIKRNSIDDSRYCKLSVIMCVEHIYKHRISLFVHEKKIISIVHHELCEIKKKI